MPKRPSAGYLLSYADRSSIPKPTTSRPVTLPDRSSVRLTTLRRRQAEDDVHAALASIATSLKARTSAAPPKVDLAGMTDAELDALQPQG